MSRLLAACYLLAALGVLLAGCESDDARAWRAEQDQAIRDAHRQAAIDALQSEIEDPNALVPAAFRYSWSIQEPSSGLFLKVSSLRCSILVVAFFVNLGLALAALLATNFAGCYRTERSGEERLSLRAVLVSTLGLALLVLIGCEILAIPLYFALGLLLQLFYRPHAYVPYDMIVFVLNALWLLGILVSLAYDLAVALTRGGRSRMIGVEFAAAGDHRRNWSEFLPLPGWCVDGLKSLAGLLATTSSVDLAQRFSGWLGARLVQWQQAAAADLESPSPPADAAYPPSNRDLEF